MIKLQKLVLAGALVVALTTPSVVKATAPESQPTASEVNAPAEEKKVSVSVSTAGISLKSELFPTYRQKLVYIVPKVRMSGGWSLQNLRNITHGTALQAASDYFGHLNHEDIKVFPSVEKLKEEIKSSGLITKDEILTKFKDKLDSAAKEIVSTPFGKWVMNDLKPYTVYEGDYGVSIHFDAYFLPSVEYFKDFFTAERFQKDFEDLLKYMDSRFLFNISEDRSLFYPVSDATVSDITVQYRNQYPNKTTEINQLRDKFYDKIENDEYKVEREEDEKKDLANKKAMLAKLEKDYKLELEKVIGNLPTTFTVNNVQFTVDPALAGKVTFNVEATPVKVNGIESTAIYDISAKLDGLNAHDFEKSPITVTFPKPANAVNFRVIDLSNNKKIVPTVGEKTVSFKATHFSKYALQWDKANVKKNVATNDTTVFTVFLGIISAFGLMLFRKKH